MYEYYNVNPIDALEDDCVIRALSCATNRSWDSIYDELSNLAQYNRTMMDNRNFIRWYLDNHFKRIYTKYNKVIDVAENFKNNIVLCTMRGHICCIKYGRILDTFNPSERMVEDVWLVK